MDETRRAQILPVALNCVGDPVRARPRRRAPTFWLLSAVFSAFLLTLFSPPLASGSGKTVVLRFLKAKSGKPIVGADIGVYAWNVAEYHGLTNETVFHKLLKTDKDGRIIVELPDPVPKHLGFAASWDLRGCSTRRFPVEEVLTSGVVAAFKPECGELKWKPTARPGEIVIVDIPLTFWDKIKRL